LITTITTITTIIATATVANAKKSLYFPQFSQGNTGLLLF